MPLREQTMKKTGPSSSSISDLRERAEELLRQDPGKLQKIPGRDIQRLIHELGVHQIELEMQNEELHRAQIELNDLLNKYFDLYELAPIGYFTLDRKGIILEANLTGANLLGKQMRYLLNRGLSRFIARDYQDAFYFHLKGILNTKIRQRCELELVREDGTRFHARLESVSVEETEGDSRQLRTAIIDISDRKQAEEELRKSEEQFRRLTEAAFEAIAIHAKGVLLRANEQYYKMFGYKPDELLGKDVLQLVLATESRELVKRQISSGSTGHYEAIGVRKDGTKFPIEVRAREIEYEERKVRVAAIMDVTEHKLAEEALRKSRDELEQRVHERTAELMQANERLRIEIEERKQVERALREREAELETRSQELEEANSALRILLSRVDGDKEQLEQKVLVNVKELTLPYLEKLKMTQLSPDQRTYVNILESNLSDVVSPFAHKLSSKYLNLTPAEIQVATLIKAGRRSKEIAELLRLSVRTIEVHRQSIRTKLGLKNRKVNLRSHLLSLP